MERCCLPLATAQSLGTSRATGGEETAAMRAEQARSWGGSYKRRGGRGAGNYHSRIKGGVFVLI